LGRRACCNKHPRRCQLYKCPFIVCRKKQNNHLGEKFILHRKVRKKYKKKGHFLSDIEGGRGTRHYVKQAGKYIQREMEGPLIIGSSTMDS